MNFSSVYSSRPQASDRQVLIDHNTFIDRTQALVMDHLHTNAEWLFIHDTEQTTSQTPVTGLCLKYVQPAAFLRIFGLTPSKRSDLFHGHKMASRQWVASHLFFHPPEALVSTMDMLQEQAYLQQMYAHLYERLVNFACGYTQKVVQIICRSQDLSQAINIGHLPTHSIEVMPDTGDDMPLAIANIKVDPCDLKRYQQMTSAPITLHEGIH